MLIADLKFTVWAEMFRGHADLITALSFDGERVSVELNTADYVWKTTRNLVGIELYYYESKNIDFMVKKLGSINHSDYGAVIVC